MRDGHGALRHALNKCYADDLLILAAKKEALQQKADIMSAIAILFKMKINITNLRLFYWSTEMSITQLTTQRSCFMSVTGRTNLWSKRDSSIR